MCEHGVNPEALAAVIKELRREAAAIKAEETSMIHPQDHP
jgi:mitotic-spindle organizing protein 1